MIKNLLVSDLTARLYLLGQLHYPSISPLYDISYKIYVHPEHELLPVLEAVLTDSTVVSCTSLYLRQM